MGRLGLSAWTPKAGETWVDQQRPRSVAGGDCCDADGSDTRTGDLSPPAVDSVKADGVGVEVHLDASETIPPERQQLTIGVHSPDEAERGDQPVDLAVLLPAAGGHLPSRALDPSSPPPGPAARHLGRLGLPRDKACPGLYPGPFAGLENHPHAQMGDRIVTASSQHHYQSPGRLGGLPATSAIADPTMTTGSTMKRGSSEQLLP